MHPTDFDNHLKEIVPKAKKQIVSRIGIEFIEESLSSQFVLIQENRNGLEIFKDLPLTMFKNGDSKTFYQYSAFFFPYHLDIYDYMDRALMECLCTYYSVSFTLLRMSLEMIIRGSFWQCMSDANYRNNSLVLDGIQKKKFMKVKQEIENKFHLLDVSASIYDIKEVNDYNLRIKDSLLQLQKWEITYPINEVENEYYSKLYKPLCKYTHAHPDNTDLASRMFNRCNFSNRGVDIKRLLEFNKIYKKLIDFMIVLEGNLLQTLIKTNVSIKNDIKSYSNKLNELHFKYSPSCMEALINSIKSPPGK